MNNAYRRDHELPYFADETIVKEQLRVKKAVRGYNAAMPFDPETGLRCMEEIGLHHAGGFYFEPPFHCEYGSHIHLGENFYANTGCVMLDVATITIGKNVLFGPNVSLYTAGHPIHPDSRHSGYEYGIPITIGDNVWIGGGCIILPGVTIGDNTVIGAGSVVTKDIPANVCAAGNPCRVIRPITEEDKPFYYKDRRFDDEVWQTVTGASSAD